MKKTLQKTILICAISIGILSCSSDGNSDSTPTVDYIKDAPSLMRNMTLSGAVLKNGDIPVPSGTLSDNIESMPTSIIVTSNSLFTIPVKTTTTDDRIPRIVFIKLEGSNQYYQIEID